MTSWLGWRPMALFRHDRFPWKLWCHGGGFRVRQDGVDDVFKPVFGWDLMYVNTWTDNVSMVVKETIQCWLCFQFHPSKSWNEILQQIIWFNSNMLTEGKPIFWKNVFDHDLSISLKTAWHDLLCVIVSRCQSPGRDIRAKLSWFYRVWVKDWCEEERAGCMLWERERDHKYTKIYPFTKCKCFQI